MKRGKKTHNNFSKNQRILVGFLLAVFVIELVLVINLNITGNSILKSFEEGIDSLFGISKKSTCIPSEEICDGVDNDCDGGG